jgi:uncharacterized protein (DUF1501 family)
MTIITRRRFLQGLGATSAAVGLSACGAGIASPAAGGSPRGPIPIPASPILVVVNVDGGNDWLSMMPPADGANRTVYEQRRATLGIPLGGITGLGSGVGLNKDFIGMADLHALGRVAWIPGIGMNNPNLSHFVSIDLWGQGSANPNGTGWLGRFADSAFDVSEVLRGLTVTSDLPVMLRGGVRRFASIPSPTGYVYPAYLRSNLVGTPYDSQLLENGFAAAVTATDPDPASQAGYAAAASAGKLFLDAQNRFGANGSLAARTPSVLYPGDPSYAGDASTPGTRLDGSPLSSSLSNQLKLVAQMIAAELPVEVYFCRLGGWDTHSNQAVDHPNLQRTLGGSLKAFYDDLAAIQTQAGKAQDRVMMVAYSEFGRRVQENKGGTDHGTAGLSFAIGNAVRGGLYGGYPDFGNLDANGNMKYTTDFRSLYAIVLERWLGLAGAATDGLLGSSYPRLGLL